MLNLKTVVFLIFTIMNSSSITTSLGLSNNKLNKLSKISKVNVNQITNINNILDSTSKQQSPLDREILKFKNLIASANAKPQELKDGQKAENFGDFVRDELNRSEDASTNNGVIDLEEYKARLKQVQARYFLDNDFVNESINQFSEANYDNNGSSKDALDLQELSDLIYSRIEKLLVKIKTFKRTPLEKVFNLRSYLEEIQYKLKEEFSCEKVTSDFESAEFIKRVVQKIPLKSDAVADLIKDLTSTSVKQCDEIKKNIEERLSRVVKPIEDGLKKAYDDAGIKQFS